MPLPRPIAASQTDAKSPVDQDLCDSIREDLDYLNGLGGGGGSSGGAGGGGATFKVMGPLGLLSQDPLVAASFKPVYRLDGAYFSSTDATLQGSRALLGDAGDGGTLEYDVLKYTSPDAKITSITKLFTGSIQSVGRATQTLTTQSVARAAAQLATQSIAKWKPTLAIQSIQPLANGLVRINVDTAPDADYLANDTVTIAGASTGANNGTTFTLSRINVDGSPNLIIQNSSAVLQLAPGGTVQLNAYRLTFINPVPANFAANENVTLAGHSNAANNGQFPIYATQRTGNNIIIKSATMVEQGSPAGTADTNRWLYAFTTAASATDYAVGEFVTATGHASTANNGQFLIRAVNAGGNNVIVYNAAGAAQGVGGSVNTSRWAYQFSVDPSPFVSLGHKVEVVGSQAFSGNDGIFDVVQINRDAGFNLVVHNFYGSAQTGAQGTLTTLRALVRFSANQPTITAGSVINIVDTPVDYTQGFTLEKIQNNGDYPVLEVNRGGGNNYNAVVESRGPTQALPAGRVARVGVSIFATRPSATIVPTYAGFAADKNVVVTGGVLHGTNKNLLAGDYLQLAITKIPNGNCRNLTVQVS